jgi:hypothetical protein
MGTVAHHLMRENYAMRHESEPERVAEDKLFWMEAIRRLDAAYTVGGTEALAKMNGIEIHVLYAEKMTELDGVRKRLAEHGSNEINQLHKKKLERQTADMAAWMRVHCPDFREMEKKEARTSLAELKARGKDGRPGRQKSRDKGLER